MKEPDEKPKVKCLVSDEKMSAVFEEARLKSEAESKDPNRVIIPEDQRVVDMGDHNFMTDESDVEAFKKRAVDKTLGRHNQS